MHRFGGLKRWGLLQEICSGINCWAKVACSRASPDLLAPDRVRRRESGQAMPDMCQHLCLCLTRADKKWKDKECCSCFFTGESRSSGIRAFAEAANCAALCPKIVWNFTNGAAFKVKRPFSDLPPPKDRLGASVHPTATLLHLSWSGSFRLWGRCTWRTLLQTAATSEIGTFVLWKVQFSGVLASLSRTLDKMEPISFKCQGKSWKANPQPHMAG